MTLEDGAVVVRFTAAYGFRNVAQTETREIPIPLRRGHGLSFRGGQLWASECKSNKDLLRSWKRTPLSQNSTTRGLRVWDPRGPTNCYTRGTMPSRR
ncbi:hypothetical protein AOXY_G15227 [Acipenser oxyrinchus oxyrinchus]|uniref:Uncharacterized protein n=1 Tax=Acipenser oxyrinchus oxyrinchus TaxID=40147 RepID=A0AAD8D904_ACIOX|nr:hypothetical protein AOXY_G15227 [Acipenser oxyrinchus oxyrinchus]